MGILGKLFGKGGPPAESKTEDGLFMEHPTGQFPNAVAAMTSAIERLRSIEAWENWITFSGQGAGARPDSYHIVDVRVLREIIDVGAHRIDVDAVLKFAGLESLGLQVEAQDGGKIRISNADSAQFARFLDGVFRNQLGVRPFDGEDDYAVGAEW